MDEKNLVQFGLELDTTAFKQGLSEAQTELQTLQQGVGRLNQQQESSAPAPVAAPLGQGAPAPPTAPLPSAKVPPPSSGTEPPENPIASIRAEMERIRSVAKASPDVALMQLQGYEGSGGLRQRVLKGAIGAQSPEEQEQYQELIRALKELTQGVKKSTDQRGEEGDPASNMLHFMRNDFRLRAVGMVGQQFAQGDMLGGVASGGGALLGGMLGGPAGAMAGAQIGQMLSSLLAPFLGGATEAEKMAMDRADISARFGDFGQERGLTARSIGQMDTSGYDTRETMQMFDLLRQSRVISGVDEESKVLVENIQALSRALGENTEAIVRDYSSYENLGGQQDVNQYMAQMIGGAVSAGMRENLDQYREIVGSAQMQLVYRSGMGDYSGEGMQGIQGILSQLMGQNNRTSELLQDNPMMAQQMLGSLLATGASRSSFGVDQSLMQMAGINAAHTTEGYISAGQQTENALQRQSFISQNFLQQAMGTMGFSDSSQLFSAAQANPNLIQDLLSDRNPNTGQARQLQQTLDVQIATALGKPLEGLTSQDRQLSMQMLQAYVGNQGSLTPDTITADGQSLQELVSSSQKTEADRARDAIAEQSAKIAQLMEEFQPLFTDIRQNLTDLVSGIADLVLALEPAKRIAEAMGRFGQTSGEFAQGFTGIGTQVGSNVGMLGTLARASLPPPLRAAVEVGGMLMGRSQEPQTAQAPQPPQERGSANIFTQGLGMLGNLASPVPIAPAMRILEGMRQPDNPIDAEMNDSPMTGVVASPGFDTFRFRHGDRVTASQPTSISNQASSFSPVINVNLTVPGGADSEWMRNAAREGASIGLDEFTAAWRGRDRGGASLEETNY